MIDAQESMFKDYGAMLGSFCGNFKSATIKKITSSELKTPTRH
jgi:hypothetical protein